MGLKKTLRALLACAAILAAAPVIAPGAGNAWAAGPDAAPATGGAVETQDLESLLRTIEDPAEREKLAAQLRAMIAARQQAEPETGVRFFDAISESVDAASQKIAKAAQAMVDVPTLFHWLARQVSAPEARTRVVELAAKLALVVGIAWLAKYGVTVMLRRPRRAAEARGARGGLVLWGMRFAHIGLDLAPVVVFAAVAYVALPFTNPDAVTRAVAIAVVNAAVLVRLIMVAAAAVLSPDVAGLRLLPVTDETAQYAHLWVRRLAGTAVYGYFAAAAALALGLHRGGFDAALNALGLVVTLMLVILILQNRRAVAAGIRGPRPAEGGAMGGTLDSLRALLADTWHVVAILYMAALYFVWALRVPGGFRFVLTAGVATVAIVVVARLGAAILERAIERGFSVRADIKERFPSLEDRANRYLPVLSAVMKTVIYAAAVLGLLQVWGLESLAWLTAGAGRDIAGTVFGVAFVLLAAAVVFEGAMFYMESYLTRTAADTESAEHLARVQTLLPLFRKVLLMVLGAVVALVVLAQIGINIAPLLAGAGVVGLAIGFGAQKLVQDVLNGLFIYLEAAVAVGDIIELGPHGGVVEAMSMRSIRLRDLEGNVHTIPFSAVTTVMNRTKGFSYYVFDIGVGYGEDVDRVIEVLQDIAAGMRHDKNIGPNIIEDMEMLGLDKFGDSAVIVKGRLKTLPARQWLVGREFNRRVKKRFDELGIEIPFPQRMVHMRVPPSGAAGVSGEAKP